MTQVRAKGAEIIARARAEHRHIIVLAGRPYHVDPEVNHGIGSADHPPMGAGRGVRLWKDEGVVVLVGV